jgi:hypothetical protein
MFGLFDAARDEQVLPALLKSRLPYHSLYDGTARTQFMEIAPYLVALPRDHAGALTLVDQAAGKSWAIFLGSEAPLLDVRRHLRRFLKVELEGRTRVVFFRFYDPRVLRDFLPTCDGEQLGQLFGPIRLYICEGANSGEYARYTVVDGQLQREALGADSVPG